LAAQRSLAILYSHNRTFSLYNLAGGGQGKTIGNSQRANSRTITDNRQLTNPLHKNANHQQNQIITENSQDTLRNEILAKNTIAPRGPASGGQVRITKIHPPKKLPPVLKIIICQEIYVNFWELGSWKIVCGGSGEKQGAVNKRPTAPQSGGSVEKEGAVSKAHSPAKASHCFRQECDLLFFVFDCSKKTECESIVVNTYF
jgi:hypothetical protein